MPGMNGFEVCRKLKSDPLTSLIPVVFLTPSKATGGAPPCHRSGRRGVPIRPVDESELIATIRAMQKIKRAARSSRMKKKTLPPWWRRRPGVAADHTAPQLLEDLHAENEARKKNEEALRDSEDKFRYLFDYSGGPKIGHPAFRQFTGEPGLL